MKSQAHPPSLKNKVDELQIGDLVYIENEWGDFLLLPVVSFYKDGTTIRIGDYRFNKKTGAQIFSRPDHTRLFSHALQNKCIHLGDGILFTEDQKRNRFRNRQRTKDRNMLINEIKRATVSDWDEFEDALLLHIVDALHRLDHLPLQILRLEPDDTENETFTETDTA